MNGRALTGLALTGLGDPAWPDTPDHTAPTLGDLAWPDVDARAARSLLAVPVGATEQHGPHLPLSTDTDIAVALARGLAAARPDVVIAPPIAYGSSGEHAGFAGTLSIGQDALEHLLVELVRSADAFAGTLLISTHGGNAEPVARAVARLTGEGRRVRVWSPQAIPGDDAHAGHAETSVVLALTPGRVRASHAAPGVRTPLPALLPALKARGVRAVSHNGVLGDPCGASPTAGAAILDRWTASLVEAVEGWPVPEAASVPEAAAVPDAASRQQPAPVPESASRRRRMP